MQMHLWFATIMLASMLYGRMHVLAIRGGIPVPNEMLLQRPAHYAWWPILVWGFAALEWWYVLLTFSVILMAAGFIVHPRFFVFWFKSAWVLETGIVMGTVWLWLSHWPF